MDLRLVLNVFTSNVQRNVGSYGIIVITIVASYTVKILFLLLLLIRNSVWMATNWYFLGYYGGYNYHSPSHRCDMSNQQYNKTVFCKTFVVKLRCRWKSSYCLTTSCIPLSLIPRPSYGSVFDYLQWRVRASSILSREWHQCLPWQGIQPTVLQLSLRYSVEIYKYANASQVT